MTWSNDTKPMCRRLTENQTRIKSPNGSLSPGRSQKRFSQTFFCLKLLNLIYLFGHSQPREFVVKSMRTYWRSPFSFGKRFDLIRIRFRNSEPEQPGDFSPYMGRADDKVGLDLEYDSHVIPVTANQICWLQSIDFELKSMHLYNLTWPKQIL